MQAVILAAGKGTRMGALTAAVPKPLLAVNGRPIIGHILTGMVAAGVDRVVVVNGYLGEQIEAALGDGSTYGLRIVHRRQRAPRGTARALLAACDVIADAPFMLSWGDILVAPGLYRAMVKRFAARPCDALLALNEVDDPWRGAAVYVDADWRVRQLVEKPSPGTSTTRWNNAGIFVFDPLVLDYAERAQPSARGEFELPQAIAAMVADGRRVDGIPVAGFWSDVGTPEDLRAAEAALGSADR